LAQFTEKLDAAIVRVGHKGGVFVKLSTRSPKDSGIFGNNMKSILLEEYRKLIVGKNLTEEQIHICDITAYTRTSSYTLRVVNGKEAARLLLRSQRVFTDISFALLAGGDKFDLQVVFREWCPEILPEWEFRAFVWNKHLTCCTQYYSDCYVPEMAAKKDLVAVRIQQFIQTEILPKLPPQLHTLTVDLALSPDLSQVWLVEIGNPPPVAGTGLYDWDLEKDRKIITENKEFDLRILHGIPKGAWEKLHKSVKQVLLKERGIVSEDIKEKKSLKTTTTSMVVVVVAIAVIVIAVLVARNY